MKKAEDKILNFKSTKDLALGMATYTSGSIFGPLVLFGGLGYFIDSYFSTKPIFILVGVLVAFIFSNILIFKKLIKLNKDLEKKIIKETSSAPSTPSTSSGQAGSTPKGGQAGQAPSVNSGQGKEEKNNFV